MFAPPASNSNVSEISISVQKPEVLGLVVQNYENLVCIVGIQKNASKEVKSKFQIGDKIIAVNGLKIRNMADAEEEIATKIVGETISFLIQRANMPRQTLRGEFFTTVGAGNIEEAERLLLEEPTWVNDFFEGATALILASRKGFVRMVEFLLLKGAAVDIVDKEGNTALMEASKLGHADVAELLIKAGATTTLKNKAGDTALIEATASGHEHVVNILLRGNAKVDSEGYLGYTALMQASMKGYQNLVEILLNAGARINLRSTSGWTALILAAQYDRVEVVQMLVSGGANVEIKGGPQKKNALAFAKRNGQVFQILQATKKQQTGCMVSGGLFSFMRRSKSLK